MPLCFFDRAFPPCPTTLDRSDKVVDWRGSDDAVAGRKPRASNTQSASGKRRIRKLNMTLCNEEYTCFTP